jgi:hypothetical protein
MEHCWGSVVVLSCWAGRACSALPAHLHDVWEPDCQSESPLPLKPGSEQTLSLGWLRPRFWQHPGVAGGQACGAAYRQGPSRLVPRLTSARSNYKLSTTILKTGLPSTKPYAL